MRGAPYPEPRPPPDSMRLALLAFCLLLGACAPRQAPFTPSDWAALADVLSAQEYAETFMDELDDRLDDADADLTGDQADAVYDALVAGAERHRAIALRYRDAGPGDQAAAEAELVASSAQTDAAVEAVLTPVQTPIYRQLQVEARAALVREVTGR